MSQVANSKNFVDMNINENGDIDKFMKFGGFKQDDVILLGLSFPNSVLVRPSDCCCIPIMVANYTFKINFDQYKCSYTSASISQENILHICNSPSPLNPTFTSTF